MELKQLNKFTQEFKLEKSDKLIKYLVILGIGVVKQQLNDTEIILFQFYQINNVFSINQQFTQSNQSNCINQDGIKLLANAYKEKSIQQEIKSLRKKLYYHQKSIFNQNNKLNIIVNLNYYLKKSLLKLPNKFQYNKMLKKPFHSNITWMIPKCKIRCLQYQKINFVESIQSKCSNLSYENNDSQHQPKRKQTFDQQPIIPQYLPKNDSQNEINPLSQRENSARQQTSRSSYTFLNLHYLCYLKQDTQQKFIYNNQKKIKKLYKEEVYHSSQVDSLHSLHSHNSPQFKDENKKIAKENKTPQGSAAPKHLRQVQSKIKQQILQDKEHYRSNHVQKVDDQSINIINNSLNPFNNTPQNKLFQPCQSTHFGSGQVCSEQQRQNQPQDSNTVTERKLFNIDEIASSFLNSPFLKSQIKQKLFNKQESASKSSASSTFSLFNPNNELKNFFQQLDKQVGNSLSFQF